MIFVGAGGLAAQLFDDLLEQKQRDIVFWSETPTKYHFIKETYPIIGTNEMIVNHFNTISNRFVLCIWDIESRKKLLHKFEDLGGSPHGFLSKNTSINAYTNIGKGVVILNGTSTEPYVSIGDYCILNKRSNYGHGCTISPFSVIGPFAIIASNAVIGESSQIGMGAIVQPEVRIGKNVTVAAGAVVSRNIPDNAVVSGVPAHIRFYKKTDISKIQL